MPERAIDALPMPASYLRLALRLFAGTPERTRRLLAGTGIEPRSGAEGGEDEITLAQQITQLRNLTEMVGSGWGLELGGAMSAAAHGPLGVATTTAPDLGTSLQVLERFAHVRAPYFRLASAPTRTHHRLRIAAQLGLDDAVWIPLLEALLLAIQALIESALGRPMKDARIAIGHPAPDHADRYPRYFHAPVSSGTGESRIEIPIAWLELRCPFADAAAFRRATDQLETAERALHGPRHLVAEVERILEGSGDAPPSLDRLAAELHLSRRTLVRRLEDCGTSFRALCDAHRGRRAKWLLADEHLPVSEVAYRLGYSDPGNFSRAFRRWFATSPAAYRAELTARRCD